MQIATFAGDNNTYYACPKPGCKRKVSPTPGNQVICKDHGIRARAEPMYAVSTKVRNDDGDGLWLKLFGNHMIQLTPKSATEFEQLNNNEQIEFLKSLCGTQLRTNLSVSKSGVYTNIRVKALQTV